MDFLDGSVPGAEPRSASANGAEGSARPVPTGRDSARATAQKQGDLFLRAGDYGQALSVFAALWDDGPEDRDLGLARRVAYCRERLGNHTDVIALLQPLLAGCPDPESLSDGERLELGRCRLILGKSFLEAGRMAEAHAEGLLASTALHGVAGAEPGFALNLLGTVCFRRGDVEQARVHFRAALEHFRNHGDVANLALGYINLGHLYKLRCDWDRALEHYQAAYYLRAAEGEFQDQGAIVQNLGLVLMKLGRYPEAKEKLETSLRRAVEMREPVRALRARLALARLFRETGDLEQSRAKLEEARDESPLPVPERELCLRLLEEAHLGLETNDLELARVRSEDIQKRVERLASRGDLMIESLLLEAALGLRDDGHDETEAALRRAFDLARQDGDRFAENRVLCGRMQLATRRGETAESRRIFDQLRIRHESGGEQPSLARLFESRGRLERGEGEGGANEAVEWYRRSRDLWRKMGAVLREARAELEAVDLIVDLGRTDEAAATLAAVVDRFDDATLRSPLVAPSLAVVEERVRRAREGRTADRIDGKEAFRRTEAILASEKGPGEKLRELLALLTEATTSDGALLARVEADSLEVLATVSMGRLQGKRALSLSRLGIADASEARITVTTSSDRQEGSPLSTLALPALLFGRPHLFWLERRSQSSHNFEQADRDYGLALVAQAARGLRTEVGGSELEEAERGIWLADVVTQNSRMLGILELVRKVGDSDLTVLLQGETGTGKKLIAQAIHRTSGRRDHSFVTVDCAALPDSLLESELFGHRKGAFTGALQDRVGLLEEANGGTIFLDEIDKAGLTVQRRFLHMLDSGEVRPVGSTSYRRLDVRVVCATSCPDLRREVEEGRFLKDLYYRLNDISILVPPLRERPDDIALLAEWFIGRYAAEQGREIAGVAPEFHAALARHAWPGNVRELEKAIRRAMTLVEPGGILMPELLPSAVLESSGGGDNATGGTLKEQVERYEQGLVREALERTGWNKSRAAARLGLTRKGLKNKIERFRMDRRRPRPGPGA